MLQLMPLWISLNPLPSGRKKIKYNVKNIVLQKDKQLQKHDTMLGVIKASIE
jgi:hypothetical protein